MPLRQSPIAEGDRASPGPVRAFVSSRMEELAPERREVKSGLADADIDAWVFEDDAGARPDSIQRAFLDEVKNADVYIGIFWRGYGEYTIDEFEQARILGKPRFIYEKRADETGHPDPNIERDRDPKLQALLEQIGDVESGLTIHRFVSPEELRDQVTSDLLAWQARKSAELDRVKLDPGLAYESILRDNVRKYWVDGALAGALHRRTASTLGIALRLRLGWDALELPGQNRLSGLDTGDLIDLYFRFDRFQLIIGPPGSGKSTLLLQLARRLLDRADLDVDEPIPVVFDLSTWSDPEQPLEDWMVQELAGSKYKASRKWSHSRLEKRRIIPLLDGLDEVKREHQEACVRAINRLKSDAGLPGLPGLVACLTPDVFGHAALIEVGGAIQLRPFSNDQVSGFLTAAGEKLEGLRALYEEGTDDELQEMAHLPLTLNVMSLAYQGLDLGQLKTRRARKRDSFDLIETYIREMYRRIRDTATGLSRDHLEKRLTWIAGKMYKHGNAVLALEELQPSWLDRRRHRALYYMLSRTIEGAAVGITIGLFVGLVAWEFAWEAGEVLLPELLKTLAGGVVVGLVPGISGGLIVGFILAFRDKQRRLERDIRSAELLRWRSGDARRLGVMGLLIGLAAGLSILLLANVGPGGWLVLPIMSMMGGAAAFLFGGVHTGIARSKETPNEGIRLSYRSAVAAGIRLGSAGWLVSGTILGLFAKEQGGLVMNLGYGILSGVPFGILAGVVGFLIFGGIGVFRNAILRWLLWKHDYLPRDLVGFLDSVASLILLQKVGGTYRFVHRFFLEYFAK